MLKNTLLVTSKRELKNFMYVNIIIYNSNDSFQKSTDCTKDQQPSSLVFSLSK